MRFSGLRSWWAAARVLLAYACRSSILGAPGGVLIILIATSAGLLLPTSRERKKTLLLREARQWRSRGQQDQPRAAASFALLHLALGLWRRT